MAAPGSAGWCDARPDAPGRTVLFAACDSPEARDAFFWSRANLLRQQDTVVLVHAYAKDAVFGGNLNVLAEGKRVMAMFEAMCKEREVRFRSVLAQGNPARIIAAAALANGCELCVMGCRGLGPVKRFLKGSVSSQVASACPCPVMVLKQPRDDAGAFLTVLPRRVFIRIDGTVEANEAFEWATKHLLSPEIDEVFLLTSSKYTPAGSWPGLGRGKQVSQHGREAERLAIDSIADAFQDECIRQGYNASKLPVESGSFHDMVRTAEVKSCDILVVGKHFSAKHEDAALYAAHNAPFPVIVVGESAEAQQRDSQPAASEAFEAPTTEPRPKSALATTDTSSKDTSSKRCWARAGRHDKKTDAANGGTQESAERGGNVSKDLGSMPRSSSLERLLNSLADTDVSCVTSSRRAQVEKDDKGDDLAAPARLHLLAVDEDACVQRPSCEGRCPSPRSPGGGMRRVATRNTIQKAHSSSPNTKRDEQRPRTKDLGPITTSTKRDEQARPPHIHCKDSKRAHASGQISASNALSPDSVTASREPWMYGRADGRTAIAS